MMKKSKITNNTLPPKKNNSKSVLGTGLESLIPMDLMSFDYEEESAVVASSGTPMEVPLDQIEVNPNQPRSKFTASAMNELVESIKTHGVIQPIIITPLEEVDKYQIVAGERRFRACQILGLKTIPAFIRNTEEREKLEIAIIENIQRENLSPLETARAYHNLISLFNFTVKDISARVGKSDSSIINTLRILSIPEAARLALHEGTISEGHAKAISSLVGHEDAQLQLLEHIIEEGWNVRKAENFVVTYRQNLMMERAGTVNDVLKRRDESLAALKAKLGSDKISLNLKGEGGRIIIEYKNDQDLARIAGI